MSRSRTGPVLAAALVLAGRLPARANPSLSQDFGSMSQWLSHELAQGLAFNAGSTFDPPKEVKGYALQPDVSLGVGRIPFNKAEFPAITTPALNDFGGSNLFPNTVSFPNLAVHLRMGLPWRGDVYARFADATTPAGYKISPSMTAQVQTNSFGAGLRQHFFGAQDQPTLTVGAHYNHIRGRTHLKGKFLVNSNGFTTDSDFTGDINWDLQSYGLTAVASQSFGAWTPFAGFGYNYVTGSVHTSLDMQCETFLCTEVFGEGSDHPEKNQGRWILGGQYGRPTWAIFANAEIKAIGQLKGQTYIVQAGVALPFEIGGKWLFRRKNGGEPDAPSRRPRVPIEDEPGPSPAPRPKLPPPWTAPKSDKTTPDMIFLR